ncbi:MAG: hypothetical protein Q4D42_11435 [Eubacteriales bacterium]|nr:hypothetical protein [Eubacteriales bacterium]
MKEERYFIILDPYDRNILLHALNQLRNQQIAQERPTDPVDELILKVSRAPIKRIRGKRYEK